MQMFLLKNQNSQLLGNGYRVGGMIVTCVSRKDNGEVRWGKEVFFSENENFYQNFENARVGDVGDCINQCS